MIVARTGKTLLISALCLTVLSGCSWLADWPPESGKSVASDAPPPPQAQVARSATGTWLVEQNPPVAGQPAYVTEEPDLRVVSTPVPAPGSEDTTERIAALEAEVEKLRNDLKMMMPAMTKLADTQVDLQKFLQTIEPAAGIQPRADTMPPSTQMAPADNRPVALQSQPAAPQTYTPGTQASPASIPPAAATSSVKQIRIGEHPDKTRIVLDLGNGGKVPFDYEIDNDENLLLVSLPATGWQAVREQMLSQSPLISSFQAGADGAGGTALIVQLKDKADVLWADILPPAEGPQARH